MKKLINQLLNKVGYHLVSVERPGVQVEFEIARLLGDKPIRCVFDVGANLGQSALRFHDAFPGCVVYSFEPAPSAFRMLEQNVSGIPAIKALNLAVGETEGKCKMFVDWASQTNSLLASTGRDEVEVRVETIDRICSGEGMALPLGAVDNIDLLKIDVEGFERQVLAGARRMLAAGAIRFIHAECSLCELQSSNEEFHTRLEDLRDDLAGHGFVVVAFYSEAFVIKHGLCVGSALFAHHSQLPATASGKTRNIY